jgi:hypothetical protein
VREDVARGADVSADIGTGVGVSIRISSDVCRDRCHGLCGVIARLAWALLPVLPGRLGLLPPRVVKGLKMMRARARRGPV